LVLCLVLLVRLPFLHQAIQGDDFYYLKGAEHALVDPLHPAHAQYVFQGRMVDMRGHPHPPLNAWYLGLLVALLASEAEVPLHAAYLLFSAIAALSALAIARKFAARPMLATVLFLVTPAFVVNGNSLEADLPFVAFWLLAVALFVHERWWLAAASGVLAALAAYQAVILSPVLAGYVLWRKPRRASAWIAALAAPATIGLYQLYERLTSGALPAGVLVGYMQSDHLEALAQKLKSAAALTGHAGWLVFPALSLAAFWRGPLWVRLVAAIAAVGAAVADPNPLFWISCGIGALVVLSCLARVREFLCWWIVVFFAAALVIFFAGSARYLLPIVLPVAILASDRIGGRWLAWSAAAQAVVAASLAIVNYQHWDGYRRFAHSLAADIQSHRTWTNAEWGFRHYLESEGAMPVVTGRTMWPGDLVVTSIYAPNPWTGPAAVLAEREITSPIPLRIIGPGTDSGYSSVAFGLAPFGLSRAPMDRVRAVLVSERKAELSALTIGTPEAAAQIVSGVYNNDRWTSDRAVVVLKRPAGATRIAARIFIPEAAPARTFRLYVDGRLVAEQVFAAPGPYAVEGPAAGSDTATVTLEADRTFSVPPDARLLGVLLLSIGYQ
jgi:hypothetical protein